MRRPRRSAQRPAVPGKPQLSRGIELRLHGRHQRIDGVRALSAQRLVALMHSGYQTLETTDVRSSGPPVREHHHPLGQRLIDAIELQFSVESAHRFNPR